SVDPLPDLRAGDLCGGCIFHQSVDRRGTGTIEPGVHVTDTDFTIRVQTSFGDRTGSGPHTDQFFGCRHDVLRLIRSHLMWCVQEQLVEATQAGWDQPGVSNP